MGNRCPVCNYDGLSEPAYDGQGYGSYEICPCCGFQFGYDDYPKPQEAILRWRNEWRQNGYKWFSKVRTPPEGWEPELQLFWVDKDAEGNG
ncbi:MAG: hypothetical protein LBN26_04260 [Christensenellaceae bacterium]|jgi:hypothetical protein|nr:hypothetical protein [Christensenellaceae bacterium]